jgi:hypothetical protein
MNERELLVDCLRRLNRTGVTYYLTILHKLVWNRISPSDRQLGDAAGLVAVQAGALDQNYLRQWAQELKLTGELERLLSGEIKPKNT